MNYILRKIPHIAFVVVVLILTSSSVFAQNVAKDQNDGNILRIKLGAGATYYYGAYDQSFDNFNNDRLNYQVNLSLGLALSKSSHPTILGLFGNMGFKNSKTVNFIFQDQDYTLTGANANQMQPNINNSYQIEAGLRLANVLRISTGYGRQYFEERTLINNKDGSVKTLKSLDYYSTTAGLQIGTGVVGFFIDANFNYGLDFNQTTITPSAGLQLQF
ncbi:MAG: hypothetical protein IE931_03255 [Sphingobacteriales bacterium]|nr:hypothetical protein [Sphingobacteriales bacterium]